MGRMGEWNVVFRVWQGVVYIEILGSLMLGNEIG